VRRRSQSERLDQGDAKRGARLGIVGQALAGGPVDQGVEIGEPAKRLGGNGEGESAVVGAVEAARGAVEGGFERQPLAEDGIEQAEGGPARAGAGWIGAAQRRGPNGSSALARGD
jgi:hypothetical protein